MPESYANRRRAILELDLRQAEDTQGRAEQTLATVPNQPPLHRLLSPLDRIVRDAAEWTPGSDSVPEQVPVHEWISHCHRPQGRITIRSGSDSCMRPPTKQTTRIAMNESAAVASDGSEAIRGPTC